MAASASVHFAGKDPDAEQRILTPAALEFIADLHHMFDFRRNEALASRIEQQTKFDSGVLPGYSEKSRDIWNAEWSIASAPADLEDRRVEITGPVDRKMIINALNSGARVFMADFEDATAPNWANVINGQLNLMDAVRRTIEFHGSDGRTYQLKQDPATLVVRPRGWHLPERHVIVDGAPVSGSLFDFGLYMFHNARELIERGSGPYFYLPKLENSDEARLWNDVFVHAQAALAIPQGTIRATVLIETITAALEMDEILFELRDHASGLNAGRWDYIFSAIKKFRSRSDVSLPDRAQITMTVPFMRAYTELLVKTCHRRAAHAIGGMAAFIPSRDPETNEVAMGNVQADKKREASDGFDGTWVAHPLLIPIAEGEFGKVLGDAPNQKSRQRNDVIVSADQITGIGVPGGTISEDGFRNNISVALQYINSWLMGFGAAGINNLMEDAATAEIARAQLWHWVQRASRMCDDTCISAALYERIRDEEIVNLGGLDQHRYRDAIEILDRLVLNDSFEDFLTLVAYEYLD